MPILLLWAAAPTAVGAGLTMIDLFPQTFHVEAVAYLKKG